jgi:hypothetical protein
MEATMRTPLSLLALSVSLLSAPGAMALSEFGIEGMGVVSTKANEAQATIAPDGQRIGLIKLPEICANICFGGARRNHLYMTASQSLYMVPVETRGAHFC